MNMSLFDLSNSKHLGLEQKSENGFSGQDFYIQWWWTEWKGQASYQYKVSIDFMYIEYWMLRHFVLSHNFVLQNPITEKKGRKRAIPYPWVTLFTPISIFFWSRISYVAFSTWQRACKSIFPQVCTVEEKEKSLALNFCNPWLYLQRNTTLIRMTSVSIVVGTRVSGDMWEW